MRTVYSFLGFDVARLQALMAMGAPMDEASISDTRNISHNWQILRANWKLKTGEIKHL